MLQLLRSDLNDPDPRRRQAAVDHMDVFGWTLKEPGARAEAVRLVLSRLERERNPEVVEDILEVLAEYDPHAASPLLIPLFRCTRDPQLRERAYDLALIATDPAMVPPLLELWGDELTPALRVVTLEILTKLGDPRAAEVAMDAVRRGLGNTADELMWAVGTREQVLQLIDLLRTDDSLGDWRRHDIWRDIAEIGGVEAARYFRHLYATTDDKESAAHFVLYSQRDRNKPPWPDPTIPREAFEAQTRARAEAARQEVLTFVRPGNVEYLQYRLFDFVHLSLLEATRAMSPEERVSVWRTLARRVPEDPKGQRRSPRVGLSSALAALAASKLPEDPNAALRLVDEASRIHHTTGLDYLKRRALRCRRGGPALGRPPEPVCFSGRYLGPCDEVHAELTIMDDGTLDLLRIGDNPSQTRCLGTFELEWGYLVLSPATRWGDTVPSVVIPTQIRGQLYLVPEENLARFCAALEQGRLKQDRGDCRFAYVREEKGRVDGVVEASELCQDRQSWP